jgi:hypothetical protein
LEIRTNVLARKNGITTPAVRSKQGLAVAIAGSWMRAEGRPAPPAKFRFHSDEGEAWPIAANQVFRPSSFARVR